MRKGLFAFCVLFATVFITSCGDQMYLEEMEPTLVLGVDVGPNNELILYSSGPIFSKEGDIKFHFVETKAYSMREARKLANSKSQGFIGSRKLQIFLIGKKMLRSKNVYPYLDLFLRDPKTNTNAFIIAVDGSIKDIFQSQIIAKGRPGVVLRNIAKQSFHNGSTILTPIYEFQRQFLDRRQTPYISELKPDSKQVTITGITLLKEKNAHYVASLNNRESALFLCLKNQIETPLSLPINLSEPKKEKTDLVNLEVKKAKSKISLQRNGRHLTLHVNVQISADLGEHVEIKHHPEEGIEGLQQRINQQLQIDFQQLIKKLQTLQVDPVGFGRYVKAFEYPYWLTIKDQWTKAFSKCQIKVKTKVKIRGTGVING